MRRLAPLWISVALLGCTTTVHEADCTCSVNTPEGRVEMAQETREYKKRPLLDKLQDAVLAVFATVGL